MTVGERAPIAAGRSRITVAAIVLVTATLVGCLVERFSAASNVHAVAMPSAGLGSVPSPAEPSGPERDALAPSQPDRLPGGGGGGVTEADGVVPAGVTVFDGGYPAVAKLDPDLLGALRRAATVAA